jgi:hypothetical protein
MVLSSIGLPLEHAVDIKRLKGILRSGEGDGLRFVLTGEWQDGDISELFDSAMKERNVEISLTKVQVFGTEILFCYIGGKERIDNAHEFFYSIRQQCFCKGLNPTEIKPKVHTHNHFNREFLPSAGDWSGPEYAEGDGYTALRYYIYSEIGFTEYSIGGENFYFAKNMIGWDESNLVVVWESGGQMHCEVIPNTAQLSLTNEDKEVYQVISPVLAEKIKEGVLSVVFIEPHKRLHGNSSGRWVRYSISNQKYSCLSLNVSASILSANGSISEGITPNPAVTTDTAMKSEPAEGTAAESPAARKKAADEGRSLPAENVKSKDQTPNIPNIPAESLRQQLMSTKSGTFKVKVEERPAPRNSKTSQEARQGKHIASNI